VVGAAARQRRQKGFQLVGERLWQHAAVPRGAARERGVGLNLLDDAQRAIRLAVNDEHVGGALRYALGRGTARKEQVERAFLVRLGHRGALVPRGQVAHNVLSAAPRLERAREHGGALGKTEHRRRDVGNVDIAAGLQQGCGVVAQKREGAGRVHAEREGVHAVVAVRKLHHGAVVGADSAVVRDAERLEVLDQAALQVAGARRLHRSVQQAFAAGHAVEKVFLRPHARQEPVGHVAASARRGVKGREARQRATTRHSRHASALERLLAQHAADLALVHR